MRNTYSCPKCHSPEILRIPEKPGHSGANNIYVGGNIFGAVLVTRYLCAQCGFTEEWVDDHDGLEKVRAKYRG